jgi:molybdate transport system substrate-binding protein
MTTMLRRSVRAGIVAVALACATAGVPAAAQATTVYAASSLRDVFPRIDGGMTFSFGASNTLQLQIDRGAPADLFASASPAEPQALYKEKKCGRPAVFATNILVLVVPKSNPAGVRSVYSLAQGPAKRLAIGAPGVPVGSYTRRLLARMRLGRVLTGNIVSNEQNVAGVVTKVALGSAEAGFVYVTDGKIASDRVRTIRLPTWAQPPIRYAFCIVQRPGGDQAGAQAFANKVRSPRGRRLLHDAGFGLPGR